MVFLCKFGQHSPIGSGDRVQTRLIFSLYSVVTIKIRSRSPKSDQIFKPSQRYNIWSLTRICHLIQERWFKDLITFWWPWLNFQYHHTIKTVKFSNFDQKSLSAPYLHPNVTIYEVWPESVIWFKRKGADKLFGQNLKKISKCWCDLENEVKVIKI